jgi:alginate O-acetyltransferase complex protein AlgI
MRFNSYEFAFFLPVVLLLWSLTRGRSRHVVLLAASYVFYASWNPPFVVLLWLSTWLDYVCGGRIARTDRPGLRRAYLAASLTGNLGILVYFKYGNFFLDNVAFVSGIDPEPFYLNVVIPLGISFYTFQTMSYTLDVYRGTAEPCDDLLEFALYVTFFPQLIAGPILRASQFLPQLRRTDPLREDEILRGVELFLGGLFKKVVIADNFGLLADRVYADPTSFSAAAIWVGSIAFAIQIYGDFSGYSEMAQGLGHFFGFRLPRNFDYPMLRWNPLLVRQGWHRTMGAWFADYVFRPLGGAAVGNARFALNLIVMWTLIGLWHGASWHFVIWGFNNGVILSTYLVVLRSKQWSLPEFPGKRFCGWLVNFSLWIPSIIFFRAQSMEDVATLFRRLLTLAPGTEVGIGWLAFEVGCGLAHLASFKWNYEGNLLQRVGWPARIVLVSGTVLATAMFAATARTFIYFQF